MKHLIKKLFFAIVVSVIVVMIYKVVIFLKIDKCLDQGGEWDYQNGICKKF